MVVINYIKPHIVISADYLMTGVIHIYNNHQIIEKIPVYNKNAIYIENTWQSKKNIKVALVSRQVYY